MTAPINVQLEEIGTKLTKLMKIKTLGEDQIKALPKGHFLKHPPAEIIFQLPGDCFVMVFYSEIDKKYNLFLDEPYLSARKQSYLLGDLDPNDINFVPRILASILNRLISYLEDLYCEQTDKFEKVDLDL